MVTTKGGWFAAALAFVWRFTLKVDEGRIHDALGRLETKVDGIQEDVSQLRVDVGVLQAEKGGAATR